ncbi:excisionase family DNA-binding protein, partial [Marinobacter sp.]
MSAQKIVHLPTAAEVEQAKLSSRTLSKYADVDRVQLSLRGSNGEADELVLPGHVLQILLDMLAEVSQGNAISLIPYHQEISTQDAANLLNVSRPFLVRLLEAGDIPFRKVGAHRR